MGSADNDRESEAYLARLSDRLRGLRARRGISRRTLGQLTGISQRYLARMEAGRANPTVDILWRIAQALGIETHEILAEKSTVSIADPSLMDLVRALSPSEQAQAHALLQRFMPKGARLPIGVALVGLHGGGKSTLGRMLSERAGYRFIAMGDIIRDMAGMELEAIFSLGGQQSYRRYERMAVEHMARHCAGCVVEAGGSIVSELDTFNTLRASFFTVWVRAEPEDHMSRVIQGGDLRPIRSTSEAMLDLQRILEEREPLYRKCDYTLETSGRTADECYLELVDVVRPYLAMGGQSDAKAAGAAH